MFIWNSSVVIYKSMYILHYYWKYFMTWISEISTIHLHFDWYYQNIAYKFVHTQIYVLVKCYFLSRMFSLCISWESSMVLLWEWLWIPLPTEETQGGLLKGLFWCKGSASKPRTFLFWRIECSTWSCWGHFSVIEQ